MWVGVVAALCTACAVGSAQTGQRQVSLIVSGGTVVTMDATNRVIPDGAVAIDGFEIVGVDTAAGIGRRFRGRDAIDARGQIVLPGLINTHTHAPMVLYRGLADDLALMEWLENYIFPAEAKTVSPEFVRAGTRLAALEMIQSGTTTYADMYYFEEEIARETKAAGLRAVLGQTVIQFPVADARTPAEGLSRAEAFIKAFKGDALITPAVAPHAMYTLDAATLRAARDLSRRHGVPTLIHVAETRDEVKNAQDQFKLSPVAYLDSLGFLGPGVLAAHGVWVTEPEVLLLRARGVGVSHNPESNMKLASGTAPVPAYLKADVAIGLGTDGAASNNDLDMFEAMRLASFLAKHLYVDWRHGARHFFELLVDGDVANNVGNWQWVAGTGADTRPNRVFNPVRQARRFDPTGAYVRRYVPELAHVEGAAVHEPWRLGRRRPADYPDPIVDHDEAVVRFRAARRRDATA